MLRSPTPTAVTAAPAEATQPYRQHPLAMNTLLEPAGAPSYIPDLMLLDEEGASANAWLCSAPGLACFAPLGGCSAPVPIAAPAGRHSSPSGELVDSLESTQTLLGASLHDGRGDAAASRMHFVPVPAPQPPPQPQPYHFQQQPRHSGQQYASLAPADDMLYGGYGVVAPPQPPPAAYPLQPAQQQHGHGWAEAQAQQGQPGWGAHPHSTQRAMQHHAAAGPGISSMDLQYGYSTQFGQVLPIPSAMRHTPCGGCLAAGAHARCAAAGLSRSGAAACLAAASATPGLV
ncbi:hypothetical protein ABPG75_013861 [Micractinium tetrahymenae]